MNKKVPIIISVVIVFLCAVFCLIYNSINQYSLEGGTYVADPEIDDIYKNQMHNSAGKLDPLIYEFDYLTEKDVAALILATQECEYANPLMPLFTQECPSVHAFTLYADKMGIVSNDAFWKVTKNLAFHPNEKVRQMNLNFLLDFMSEHPDELIAYMKAQHSEGMDYVFYNDLHHPSTKGFASALMLNEYPQVQAYFSSLKDSATPLLRATIYEENMTPRDIVEKTENTKEGTMKVFYADGVMTPKEAEAIFLLFERCQFNETDLMPKGDCYALDAFDQFLNHRVFRQDELDLGALIKKMWKHEHPTVRAVAWTLSHHLYPKDLLEQLQVENDVLALGAYVWLSKHYYPNNPEMQVFYRKIAEKSDDRLKKLVEVSKLSAEDFENRLLKLKACGDIDKRCPEFDEFQVWLVGYADLPVEERKVLIPVLEKYYLSEVIQISLVAASMVATMSYRGEMEQPFTFYMDELTAKGTEDAKLSALMTLMVQVGKDATMAKDSALKQSLSAMIGSLKDEDMRKKMEAQFGSVFIP